MLGALARYGDAQHDAVHDSLPMALLRMALLYLPLIVLSLAMALAVHGGQAQRPRSAHWLYAYGGALLMFIPFLGCWDAALDSVFSGHGMPSPGVLFERQTALAWWFNFLLLTVAFGGHLAYGALRHAHAQTLASEHTHQRNLALRLRLLQGQLEPYFLSSSLAGIGKLIRTEQREHATRALARLSDLLRYAIRSSQSDWQSVADELQFLRDYVDMQCLCHGNHLAVAWNLEQCDWADYRCPPLLLFPLLDQAMLACMAGGAAAHRVTVNVVRAREAGAARVQVQVSHPCSRDNADALADLRHRLVLLYGGAAALSIHSDGELCCLELAYPVARHDD